MEEKKPEAAAGGAGAPESPQQGAPADALEKTNEELGAEAKASGTAPSEADPNAPPPKKINPVKKFLKRFNVYLLLFVLVVVVAIVVSVVGYLNSKKTPPTPSATNQNLTSDDLKQLANSDATVGDSGQTLTIQGNAVVTGQLLVRNDLNVAGTIKLGNELDVPQLTVSGTSNLNTTQANTLQVAQGSTFQGIVTVQHDLNVGGNSSFSGPITAGQITVTKLIMSGNAQLQIPNHIAFPGASPARQMTASVVGVGGSASLNGSDTTGTININTGSNTQPGCFISITFNRPFDSTPHVMVSPVGAAAGQTEYYVNRSKTGFSMCTANAAPPNQVFAFDYFITD